MRPAFAFAVVLIVAGAGLIVAGIQMFFGTPLALIASGLLLLGAGFSLRAGLMRHG